MKPSDLIKKGWTQDVYARDAQGRQVYAISNEACSWCMMGAVLATDHYTADFIKKLGKVLMKRGMPANGAFANWNDAPSRTKEEVVEVLMEAEA